ncbi:MAG: DUF4376 domain-containing protein [Proteobacteria bacterium]|nr:DUF4376 domain-containing protein [Pseudomonadota bacterium]
MQRNYVIVNPATKEVVNVVQYDSDPPSPPPGYEDHPTFVAIQHDQASFGWRLEGGTMQPPPPVQPALADAKAAKEAAVERELDARNAAGVTYQGKTYQLDNDSQQRIAAIVQKADRFVQGLPNATWPPNFAFIAADNAAVPFTAAEFGAFGDAVSNIVIARRVHARSLKNQVLAAADHATLELIDIKAGWV